MHINTLSGLAIGGLLASVAQAENVYRYQGNGPWQNIRTDTSGGWHMQSSNEPAYMPLPPYPHPAPGTGTEDVVRANWGGATVTLDYDTTVWRFQIGVDESGTFHVEDGGTLTGSGDSKIGNNNTCTGTMIIDAGGTVNANGSWLMIAGNSSVTGVADVSGTMNIAGHLWMATGAGSTATLSIHDGGVVNVGANIGLGTVNASTPSGGVATINVNDGGTLNLHHWSNENTDPVTGHDGSIQDGCVLNINSGGTVTVGGNRTGQVNSWITEGKIATNASELLISYSAPDNTTTITTPRPPLVADVSDSGSDVTITWNGDAAFLYNVWSTNDLTEDLANWDPAASAVAGSEAVIAKTGPSLFYRVEEYPKPPALLNGNFDDPGGLPAGELGELGAPWVADDAFGFISSWNPEDPEDIEGKPAGPFVALVESDLTGDGTAFGFSQVLGETFAENTNYALSVRVGNPKVYDWPGYRIELWADGTLIASVDDTTAGVPLDGKFILVNLDYVAGTSTGLTPGSDLEVKLLSRNVDVDGVVSPTLDWAVAFDDVQFASSPN